MASAQTGLQSGIKVSPALVTAFNEASNSSETRALKINIIDGTETQDNADADSLEPNGTLKKTSSAEEDFPELQNWAKDDEAAYIIYFLDKPEGNYLFICYVPDTTSVRSKMLYASSRASLVSTLGLRGQKFSNQITASRKSDLVFPKDEVPISLDELSIREKELAEIKAAEAEGAHGMSKRTNFVSSSGVVFPISEAASQALKDLATGEGEELVQLVRLYVCQLMQCIEDEKFELAAANSVSKGEEIKDIVFEEEPRFTFFRFTHDYKGEQVSPIGISFMLYAYEVFIYSCPSSSTVKHRMVYASSRQAILALAAELGVDAEIKIETSDVNELTLSYLKKEIHGVEEVEEKKTFARPRGPPKRNQKAA